MTETNIRLVMAGPALYLNTRQVEVIAPGSSPDLPQRACYALRRRRLAAVPCPDRSGLLVASREPIPQTVVPDDDWHVEVQDTGQTRRLRFENAEDARLLAQLIERCLLVEIGCRTRLWTLESPRIWYEQRPFRRAEDITAYRRFEVSAVPIGSIGVGLVVDVSTAFFTVSTVADFFRDDLPEGERRRRQERFQLLSQRQQGQKGTLLYDLEQSKYRCYFEEYLPDVTCESPGKLRVHGREYGSLLEYYRQQHPELPVNPDDPVARVSFSGIDRPQRVVADRLRVRVMNEVLPYSLQQVDKIAPSDRRALVDRFWEQLGDHALGPGKPEVSTRFWHPKKRAVRVKPPDLVFARGQVLSAPTDGSPREYREYYRKRRHLLRKFGCLSVPPAMARVIHLAVPSKVGEAMAARFAKDLGGHLSTWTKKPITPEIETYDSLDEAFSRMRRETSPGVVVFVFEDEDPATYFTVSYELKEWRVKRITYGQLKDSFAKLRSAGIRDGSGDDGAVPRGVRAWRSFTEMSGLDVLQQMDCVPWGLAESLHYEAQLGIDVGRDRRHFALSLLICRPGSCQPSFWLRTAVEVKSDPKRETINDIHLRDKIVDLFRKAQRRRFDPVRSVLVLRDGRQCGQELEGIAAAREQLVGLGLLDREARMDVVDVHKSSVKGIRLWDRTQEGRVGHALEGTALFLDEQTVVIANTGAATLHQGTAEPIMLVAQEDDIDMDAIATDVHATTHLNWSSPGVAQRLPLVLKRTDDELKSRAAQEIRRIR